jgi:hypothetical protein
VGSVFPFPGVRLCCAQALLVCDMHAHLCDTGVVGFLAGTWNAEAGDVCVRAAYPVRTVAVTPTFHADMDKACADQVRC